ncbi:MAG: hypothetical protein U1F71_17225 [Verrucomicrobiaceae bacterium]
MLISSCAHESAPKQSYAGKLTYPETRIALPHGLALTHHAGEIGDEDVQADDAEVKARTTSTYHLTNGDGQMLASCGSSLSDPKFCGEFESYNRQYDDLTIFVSKTGRTVLIIEDRSPCYPHIELRLMRQKADGKWESSKLIPPHFRTDTTKTPVVNPYGSFAGIEGVTDSSVLFSHNKRHWTEPFAKIEAPRSHPT